MFNEAPIEVVNLNDAKHFERIRCFLERFDLSFEQAAEYTIAVRSDGALVGTGSFTGEILHNIAVVERMRGKGLTALILSKLMQEQATRGRMHYFIYTRPSKAHIFANQGFVEIARAEPHASLLETGLGSIETYRKTIEKSASHLPPERAAVVVNGNPFTRGDQALIQKAANENAGVIVFVVNGGESLFPFERNIELVKAGVAELTNVVVVSAGKYIVSSATFPSYFIRKEHRVTAHTRLDCSLFATQIAPKLDITARYIRDTGDEPCCLVTNAYREAMLEIFPKHGIDVRVLQRMQTDGERISASKVLD